MTSKTIRIIACLLVTLLCFYPFDAQAASMKVEGPEQIILSLGESASVLEVSWCDSAGTSYLTYGDSDSLSNGTTIPGQVTTSGDGYAYYTAEMTGLAAGTTYYYRVNSTDGSSTVFSTTTESAQAENFSILFLGDLQFTAPNQMESETEAWREMVSQVETQNELAFALQCGDLINNGQNPAQWQCVLNAASDALNGTPLMVAAGNHESNFISGKPERLLDIFTLPDNGPTGFSEEFYSFDYGNCHITVINSNIFLTEQSMDSADYATIADWIATDLAVSSAEWKIVLMHHPAYFVVADHAAQKVLENWTPLFEAGSVDLVLCGHQHIYMRTYPMKDGTRNDEYGITYVMGNSGHKYYQYYPPATVDWAEVMLSNVSTYQIITVTDDDLMLSTYNNYGKLLDQWSHKRGTIPLKSPSGDVDDDGNISESDVQRVLEAIMCCALFEPLMDVNNDGVVDICDAHLIWLARP